MNRVLLVYGTRPEAIKMMPLLHALRELPDMDARVVVTGQHREMLDQVHDIFGIRPDMDLAIDRSSGSLNDLAADVLRGVDAAIERFSPDMVVVQGDTSSAAAAALAAFWRSVPVTHLEAGLRSGSLALPFPEEGNRRAIGHVATLHLAPTPGSRQNLEAEGIAPETICICGNTVIDALQRSIETNRPLQNPDVDRVIADGRDLVVVTAHRRESWGEDLRAQATGIRRALDRTDAIAIVPMHRNPAVRAVLTDVLGDHERVVLTDPVDYFDFTRLLSHARVVVSDSGGVQEEAPSLGVPVLVTRTTTERPEGIAAGCSRLVGSDAAVIERELVLLLTDPAAHEAMAQAANPYGDGTAGRRAAEAIVASLSGTALPADFAIR